MNWWQKLRGRANVFPNNALEPKKAAIAAAHR
jgi:hypothetical protein